MVRVAVALVLLVLVSSVAHAQKRVAFVVGIDLYDNLGRNAQLQKARADAKAIADTLRALGFDVIHKDDLTRTAFNNNWQDFLNKLSPGDTAALYFAGHGVELGGRNYLLPRDVPSVRPGREELLRREALSLQEFLADLKEKGTRLNLVILDACRDNPFEQVAGRSVGSARGLAVTEPPEGTFIMFSAGSGESALDRLNDADRDPNSIYTRQLLPLLKAQGVSLTDVAEQVRVGVRQMASTVQHRQTPAYYNQVLGRICLAGGNCIAGVAAVPAITAPARLSEAAEAWSVTKDSTNIAALELFISRYENTYYAGLARLRIDEWKKQEAGVATAPRPAVPPKADPLKNAMAAPMKPAQPAVANMPAPAGCDGVETQVGNERRCLKPKDNFRDCPECPEMVVVPAGEFMMGSAPNEAERNSNEGPQHKLLVSRPRAVGKFEVTFAEWDMCVATGGCTHKPNDQGWGRGKRPVIDVSWDDAKEYVSWLAKKTGRTYRLLSESEWEYAARAGTATAFSTGGTITTDQANFNGNSTYSGSDKGVYRQKTIEVGSLNRPNAFGLHDMHGNVWEWVEDCYQDNYSAPTDGSVKSSASCSSRVLRGGSWIGFPASLRSAIRNGGHSAYRHNDVGFRLVRQLNP